MLPLKDASSVARCAQDVSYAALVTPRSDHGLGRRVCQSDANS